ncbi:GIY-YIG nuclease family protein [Malikia spinosa]|uniref:GIY-YIG nuclease family protein n=1 Tax=Malikia spinosa TaxID=86180 RepID=A0A7C9NBR4_9BURK|nr:GIY-YIG nuclease family protein [Malikia spinosa]MYZ52119.1 GIY-YIG nuclease family protein [Malikia spinosa]
MKARPRTIQIYLPRGEPRGLRMAELTTSIVRVIEVPRPLLDEFTDMPEAEQVGVYFLVNDDESQDQPAVYIGQTGGVGKRLREHHKQKEFWSRALVVVSLTQNLTQTHALYLEWSGIKRANEAGRYQVENGNAGSKPHTPAPLEADCMDIFDTLRTLVATLGQPIFEPLTKGSTSTTAHDTADTFYLKSSRYDAVGEYTDEGMVVLAGSKARKTVAGSMAGTPLEHKRQGLIDEGALKLEGEFYVFQRNVLFKSPSGAAAIVRAASSNGWVAWVDQQGKTLDELKRQNT